MKKIIFILIVLLLIYFNKDISTYIIENFVYSKSNTVLEKNDYTLSYNYKHLNKTNDFKAYKKEDLMNIFYTFINGGNKEFDFYCEYDGCRDDVNEISSSDYITTINNFVHPYNSYKKVYITINNFGKVHVTVEKTYTDEEINKVNQKIEEIKKEIINDNMTDKEKIIAFHDYIIDNTKYDKSYIDNNLDDPFNPSHKATGLLFNGKALCGGYSDTMAIFLNQLNLPNFLIASEYHVWNAIYIDNSWLHLDLTWDDPVTSSGSDLKLDKFLLINDEALDSFKTGYHNYNQDIYLEFQI